MKRGFGAARGTRTPDPIITNDVLYQLSYCGGALQRPIAGWKAKVDSRVFDARHACRFQELMRIDKMRSPPDL